MYFFFHQTLIYRIFFFLFFQVFYRTYQEYIPAKFCHSSQFMDFFMLLSFWLFKNASNRRKWTNANSMSEEKVTQENAKCQKVQWLMVKVKYVRIPSLISNELSNTYCYYLYRVSESENYEIICIIIIKLNHYVY